MYFFFRYDFDDGMWDSIALVPDHCLSFYFMYLDAKADLSVSGTNFYEIWNFYVCLFYVPTII